MTKLIRITTNQAEAVPVKRITHSDGREYLIAPDVAIVEGVMNGLLYTEDEMTAYIDAWNGRPLVIAHPQDLDGNFVSANSPAIFARSPGYFFNASFNDGRLTGEWWIDVEKAEKLGAEAAELVAGLEAGKLFEQSTGLFTDVDETPGEWNGTHYDGIARNIRPDHVAILFDEEGACSIEDGCGAPRVNSEEAITESPEENKQSTARMVLDYLANLMRKIDSSTTETQTNAAEPGGESETGEAEENQSEVNMSREELIEGLLALETGFVTRAMLDAADDETLMALWSQFGMPPEANEDEVEDDIVAEATEVVEGVETPAETPQVLSLPPELNEVVSMIGRLGGVSAVEEALQQSRAQAVTQIDEMIGAITANTDQFTADELRELPKPILQKMAGLARSAATVPNMIGRGMGVNYQQEDEWEEWNPQEVN